MQRRYTPDWYLPDLNKHQPDCSTVTNEQLKKAISAHWPNENGVAKIPYSFSTGLSSLIPFSFRDLCWRIIMNIYPIQLDAQDELLFRENIKTTLNNWEKASEGTIEFYEKKTFNLWSSPGIQFYITTADALKGIDAGAAMNSAINNNGDLQSAAIYFPNNSSFLNITQGNRYKASAICAYHHEVGHALGFEHLHEYVDIQNKLTQIPDAVFCSVMPYSKKIASNVSACNDHCNPPYAVLPGALDKVLININYKNNLSSCDYANIVKLKLYYFNAWDSQIFSFIISYMHHSIYTFFSNLSSKQDPIFSDTCSHIIADSSLLGAMIYTQMPTLATGLFLITAATKYLPDTVLNKLPSPVKAILTSDYSIYILNFSIAYMKGQCVIPWVCTTIASGLGTMMGASVGEISGKFAANTCNYFKQVIYAKCFQQANSSETDHDCSLNEVVVDFGEVDRKTESSYLNNYSFFKAAHKRFSNLFEANCKKNNILKTA